MKQNLLFKINVLFYLIFTFQSYAQDGSLDNTFNSDGLQTSAVGTFDDVAYAMAIKEDALNPNNNAARKIIIAGQTYNGNKYEFLVMQYNDDGSLDNTFGVNGIVATSLGNYDDKARAIAIQPDGKIVVAGYSFDGTKDNFAIIRYNADGSTDYSFGTNGYNLTSIGTTADNINSIAIQSDGSIFAAGFTQSGNYMDFAVAQIHIQWIAG
jgi:uncharacterized delta-60 repeat protein